MSLLAYSLRRAAGSLLVLLLVIWLLVFAIAHIGPGTHNPAAPWNRLQPAIAQTWNVAAFEVGLAVVVLLGLSGVWRVRPKLRRVRPAVVIAGVLLAFSIASFGIALANQDYRRLDTTCPPQSRSCVPPLIARSLALRFDRGVNPTPWWIGGELAAGAGVILLGAALASRRARPAS